MQRGLIAGAALLAACAVLPGATSAAADAVASPAAQVQARLDRLEAEIRAAEDIQAIKKLQRAYGYYVDKGLWEDVAALFTEDAVANYPAGVFIGLPSIRQHLYMNVGGHAMGDLGLGDGRLYNHMNIQPVVHLDAGGKTARGRWRAFAMFGNFGGAAVWAEGVYEMVYAKQNGVWKIHKLDYYSGFGAPYQTGWVGPQPAAANGPAAAARVPSGSFARRKLAHPADRARDMECDGFPKACIAPFHYGNPGNTPSAAVWTVADTELAAVRSAAHRNGDVRQRAAILEHRAMLLQDAQQIENLQRIYGYYLDRAQWDQVADLFADDGSIEMGLRGVYVGKRHIRQFLDLLGHEGLRYGWLNDHIQLQPIADVAPDGRTARLRSRELAMTGVYGEHGTWGEGTYENSFVKQGGVWKFQSLHFYPTFITDYDQGWAKDAQPAPGTSSSLPPDRPPTQNYAIYPKAFVPPFHYRNPVTGEPVHYPPVGAPSTAAAAATLMPAGSHWTPPRTRDVEAAIATATRTVERVRDYDELENLESAYGYYLDKDLWTDLANLFAEDGSMELAQRGVYVGRDHIREFLLKGLGRGHEGPVAGMLGNHMQLQPVIDIAADGRTANIRIRLFQQMSLGGRASLGAAIYENTAVKQDGVWRLKVDHAYNTLAASYEGGWVHAAHTQLPGESKEVPPDAPPTATFQMFPVVYDIPFHYANPVSGRTAVPPSPPGMSAEIAAALREIGPKIDGPRTTALYAPLFPQEPYTGVSVTRDLHYGPHERNVLDVFTSGRKAEGEPVLVFVHGGGFSRGAKHTPGSPFYDNIGLWAAAHGLVGVTINYRLAPEFQFPSGVEDLTALVQWLQAHVSEYGGDPRSIFLWGHSAGAAHVADYVAHLATSGAKPVIAGAILTSGFYDLGHEVSVWKAYYGDDVSKYAQRSSLHGLLQTATPLLVNDAELDPEMMRTQTDELVKARAQAGKPVQYLELPNHSHLSETYAVGTQDESLSAPVLQFVRTTAAAAR
ncbi:MAG TPA: nuclear transport factor 2 family protein [Steroidobacteraceae bacterium]|nr:nuclear transport factor 2 family protein [Steroidobacteraceae bacterium]